MESAVFLHLPPAMAGGMTKDPVCGMQVNESASLKSEHMGQIFYFCSQACKSNFDGNPMKYMGGHQMSMGHH